MAGATAPAPAPAPGGGGGAGPGAEEEEEHEVVRVRVKVSHRRLVAKAGRRCLVEGQSYSKERPGRKVNMARAAASPSSVIVCSCLH